MSALLKDLGIDKLTLEQRLQLVNDIWESIADEHGIPLTPEQVKELERRIARHEANPGLGSSWEDVKAQILARR